MEIYRVALGGWEMGGREVVGDAGVEVKVLRGREYYEARAGCEWDFSFGGRRRVGRWKGVVMVVVLSLLVLKRGILGANKWRLQSPPWIC